MRMGFIQVSHPHVGQGEDTELAPAGLVLQSFPLYIMHHRPVTSQHGGDVPGSQNCGACDRGTVPGESRTLVRVEVQRQKHSISLWYDVITRCFGLASNFIPAQLILALVLVL
jgi:hypothetical protein